MKELIITDPEGNEVKLPVVGYDDNPKKQEVIVKLKVIDHDNSNPYEITINDAIISRCCISFKELAGTIDFKFESSSSKM